MMLAGAVRNFEVIGSIQYDHMRSLPTNRMVTPAVLGLHSWLELQFAITNI